MDKNEFVSLDENKTRNVTFRNDATRRLRGKGTVCLNNGKGKSKDVLFVERRNIIC